MTLQELKPLKFYDQNLIANFQQRVVNISGIRCKVFTVNDDVPGSFGVRMRTGKTGKVLAINRLPYSEKSCICDSDLPEMPPSNKNPCWTNLHFHGSWVNGDNEDDVYACIRPGQQKQYCYNINKCHPTGLFIIHPHNFSSSVYLDHITTFPVQVYDKNRPDYPCDIIQESLYIAVAYMQKCEKRTSSSSLDLITSTASTSTVMKMSCDKKTKHSDEFYTLEIKDKKNKKDNINSKRHKNKKDNKDNKDNKDIKDNKDAKDSKDNKINEIDIGDNECELETFDFPRYATAPDFSERIRAAPKLVLTNGMIQPVKSFPAGVPIIIRLGFTGIADTMDLIILNDRDERLPFRILSIDSMPIATQCFSTKDNKDNKDRDNKETKEVKKDEKENIMIVKDFLAAHMQRFDILFYLPHPGQYRLVKFVSQEELANNQFSTGTRVLLFMNATSNDKLLECSKYGSGPVVPIPHELSLAKIEKKILRNVVHLENNCWARRVNRKFRHLENIAAWRNMRFNIPEFPMIEGAMVDVHINQITMKANAPEVWLIGAPEGTHSFHIHLMWFLIMADRTFPQPVSPDLFTGSNPNPKWNVIPKHEQWFQDTLTILPGQQYLIWLFPFADKRLPRDQRAVGRIFVHCHQNDHEDNGMMLTLLIDDKPSAKPSGIGLVDGPQSKEILRIVKQSACDKNNK